MQLSRRQMVLGAGASALALVGAAGVFTVTRTAEAAVAPWTMVPIAGLDPRLDVFRHAILAPNPHNMQPWTIRLLGKDEAVLSCDLQRRLPQTDPFDRQITIGFGCFLELARIAAAERGFRLDMTAFPDGAPAPRLDARPIARLRFVTDAGVAKDPLFSAILARRSTKEVFEPRPLDPALLARLTQDEGVAPALVSGTSEPGKVEALRALILEAGTIEASTRRTWMESVDVMRIGRREIEARPDGIDLGGPMIESLKLIGLLDREQLADPRSQAFQAGKEQFEASYGSGRSYLWITTPGDSRQEQLATGRAYVRANLRATQAGVAMHPASQSQQEYPEMDEPFARLHRLLAADSQRVQMLVRVGYGPIVPPAPRWPLEAKLAAPASA